MASGVPRPAVRRLDALKAARGIGVLQEGLRKGHAGWPFVALCRLLSLPVAVARLGSLLLRYPSVLRWLAAYRRGPWWALRQVAFARLVHQILGPIVGLLSDDAIRDRVVFEAGSIQPAAGALFVVFHSPWNRILARWAVSRSAALVYAGNRWARSLGALHVQRGFPGLRRLCGHLRAGGRAVMLIDTFDDATGCETAFLGARTRVSTGPARLAALARVPLVPIAVLYDGFRLRIRVGPNARVVAGQSQTALATRAVIAFFEQVVREDPSSCLILSYLRRAAALGRLQGKWP